MWYFIGIFAVVLAMSVWGFKVGTQDENDNS